MYVYIPPTLQQDFEDVLQSPLAKSYTVNFDLTNVVRAILYEPSNSQFKSPDGSFMLRASDKSVIKKGDYLSIDNTVYLVVWAINETLPNSIKSRVQQCNAKIDIKRWHDAVLDSNGMFIDEAGYNDIVKDLWAVVYNGGRPTFSLSNGVVGIVPSNDVVVAVQYNVSTQQIKPDDVLIINNDSCRVIGIDYTQLNTDGQSGMLLITSQKIPS